jgi:S1-C subfamily serine protease
MYPSYETIAAEKSGNYPFIEVYQFSPADLCQFTVADDTVRTMANPLVRGSRQMTVIQTDAAISPGNSGGPLFMGNKAIGVNSQKLVRRGVEGIGFAVHVDEVAKFLAEP